MTDAPIRLGIIGTGLAVEKLHWPALKQMSDMFTVTAFCDIDRDHAQHFADYSGTSMDFYLPEYHDLLALKDVDAVLISLPIPLQATVIRESLEAGNHVICEKPPGANEEEARALFDVEKAHPDQVLLIAENYFYRDDVRYAKSLIDQGALGRVHLATWRNVSQLVPQPGEFTSTPWRWEGEYDGGPHLDGGVHHTAQIRMLCGDAARLHGEIQDANSTHNGPSDLTLTMRFVSGAIGSYTASHPELAMPDEPNEMRIYGTEAVMGITPKTVKVYRPEETETFTFEEMDGGYYNEFLNFHDAVVHGEPVTGTLAQSFRTMEMITKGLASAGSGQVVTLEDGPIPLSANPLPLWKPRDAEDLGVSVTREVSSST